MTWHDDRGRATAVLAVDGNSLGHRAFHSTRSEGGEEPFVTGAVISMLASAWIHGPYTGVVVAFDHPVNRRKDEDPDYKAGRPPNHPDLAAHLQALRAHLGACGFLVVDREGAEADDLLAAVADGCEERGWRCDVLSSDRDLTALVAPAVRLLRPRARFADLRVEDEAAVRRHYGVHPSAYCDLAALRGDPSDGLEGARGIGPKTAARLLRDHASVTGIYAALHHLPPRIEASLREARTRVERNLLLMAPIPHLIVDVEESVRSGVDVQRIRRSLVELGLEVPARRLVRAIESPPRPEVPPPPDEPTGGSEDERVGHVAASVPTRPEGGPRPLDVVDRAEQVCLFS